MSSMWIHAISYVELDSQAASPCPFICQSIRPYRVAKPLKFDTMHKHFNQIFPYPPCLLVLLTSTIIYYFDWFGVAWSAESEAFGIHTHTFQLKFDVVLKQFKLNILISI